MTGEKIVELYLVAPWSKGHRILCGYESEQRRKSVVLGVDPRDGSIVENLALINPPILLRLSVVNEERSMAGDPVRRDWITGIV